MNMTVLDGEITAAKAYEDLHVPALFQQWAPKVLDAAKIRQGQRVLDIACGTGILAREAISRVGNNGHVAGLDPNPGMLAVARQLAPSIAWKEGVAEALPYDDNTFDVVVSQFGLMFFKDRRAALREMLRVLVPGGRIAVAVWESLENVEAFPTRVSMLERFAGKQAADALRAPFVLGDSTRLEKLFKDAGVSSVAVTTYPGTACFPNIQAMIESDLRGWLPVMGVMLTEEQIALIMQEAEQSLRKYLTPVGTVQFKAPAHIVTGQRL